MASLLQCDWLNKSQNILITGPCGSGKTYIACAMGHTACLKGYSVKYYRLSRLMLELTQAKADGTYSKVLQSLAKLNSLMGLCHIECKYYNYIFSLPIKL
jgi:DNA replication protein DnaC